MTTATAPVLTDLTGTYTIDPAHTRIGFVARHAMRSEEHTSELQSLRHRVCRLLLEKQMPQADSRAYLSRAMAVCGPWATTTVVAIVATALVITPIVLSFFLMKSRPSAFPFLPQTTPARF